MKMNENQEDACSNKSGARLGAEAKKRIQQDPRPRGGCDFQKAPLGHEKKTAFARILDAGVFQNFKVGFFNQD